jgi:hypothetical protein
MGYDEREKKFKHAFPNGAIAIKKGNEILKYKLKAEKLLEQYNIVIFKWEYTEPLVNRPEELLDS